MKPKVKLGLTRYQEDMLCALIGEWYLKWKTQIADYDDRTHRLGYAKEELKSWICGNEDDRDEQNNMKTDAQLYLETHLVDDGYDFSRIAFFKTLLRSLAQQTIQLIDCTLLNEMVFLFADGSKIVMGKDRFIAS
jgi:hypothetical protein